MTSFSISRAWRALALCCLATAAQAHELWLMPSTFEPKRGAGVALTIHIGSGWPGETVPINPPRVARFALLEASGERAVSLLGQGVPAGIAMPRQRGAAWVVYRSRDIPIELEPGILEKYLREEGLEHVIEARAAAGESQRPVRESYSRNAKTLLRVDGRTAGWDRRADLALELVPLRDPRGASVKQPLGLNVLLHGRPSAGLLVRAMPQREGAAPVSARTAADGTVALPLAPGVWLINVVHMQRASQGLDADWQSLWSSLLLRVGR